MSQPFAVARTIDTAWEVEQAEQDAWEAEQAAASLPDRPRGELRPFPTVDLAELAKAGVPLPRLLCSGLLYRGGLHSLAGPPDSGKSTIAYRWMLELLALGEAVVLLDEESGAEQVTEKLLALGAEPHLLERLVYVQFPGRRWDQADRHGLAVLLDEHRPALLVFDAAAAFLTLADRDEDRASDVTHFYKGVLLDAARAGPAVVVLDHVTKDGRAGRYARGSGSKLATVDVAFMVDPVKPFSRHHGGLLALTVTKDRRGYLHRRFEIRVEIADGRMVLTMTKVDQVSDPALAGLAPAGRKILAVLGAAGQPLTTLEIGDHVAKLFGHGLRRTTISEQLNELAARHMVDGERGSGRQKRWWST